MYVHSASPSFYTCDFPYQFQNTYRIRNTNAAGYGAAFYVEFAPFVYVNLCSVPSIYVGQRSGVIFGNTSQTIHFNVVTNSLCSSSTNFLQSNNLQQGPSSFCIANNNFSAAGYQSWNEPVIKLVTNGQAASSEMYTANLHQITPVLSTKGFMIQTLLEVPDVPLTFQMTQTLGQCQDSPDNSAGLHCKLEWTAVFWLLISIGSLIVCGAIAYTCRHIYVYRRDWMVRLRCDSVRLQQCEALLRQCEALLRQCDCCDSVKLLAAATV